MGAPRPDVARVPKTAVAGTRTYRLEPERTAIATPAMSPVKVRQPSATVDRSAERPHGPPGATSTTRPDASGSREADDPAAIINWLLQGHRPGAER